MIKILENSFSGGVKKNVEEEKKESHENNEGANSHKKKSSGPKKRKEIWIDSRYIIKKKLSKGSFGQVYEGLDTHNGNKDIICKINDGKEMNDLESIVLKSLNDKGFKNFP